MTTLSIGANLGILCSNSGLVMDRSQFALTPAADANLHNQWILKAGFAADVSYRLSPYYAIGLKGSVGRSFSNIYKPDTSVKETPMSFGLQIGIRRFLF